eukprot:m.272552 g.272552  ORF g.272552 m.272552 type:complete len:78 (+) comp16275_c1_seq8:129-362(+)
MNWRYFHNSKKSLTKWNIFIWTITTLKHWSFLKNKDAKIEIPKFKEEQDIDTGSEHIYRFSFFGTLISKREQNIFCA